MPLTINHDNSCVYHEYCMVHLYEWYMLFLYICQIREVLVVLSTFYLMFYKLISPKTNKHGVLLHIKKYTLVCISPSFGKVHPSVDNKIFLTFLLVANGNTLASGAMVTHSPPVSGVGCSSLGPYVGKLVVTYRWSAVYSPEPSPTVCTSFLCPQIYPL